MLDKDLTTNEIARDYNRIYTTFGLRANSAYYRWLIKLLKPEADTKLLDVSCGEGIFLKEIRKLNKNIQTSGLDISEIAVIKARHNSPESNIVEADGQKIPWPDKYFDYVTCLGSLEHYLDIALGIKELARVAKDNAKFCIVLPNSISIDLILGVIKTGEKPLEDFQIIEKTSTKSEWLNLLANNGVKVERTFGSNLWPELFQEGTYKIKSLPKFLKRSIIRQFCPLNLAREFVFICRKINR